MTLLQPLGQVSGPVTPEPMSALSSEALLGEGRRQGRETKGETTVLREEEKPWHTHLARYLAMGLTHRDAAEACDCHENTVSFLLSAPWFQERVAQQMKIQGSDIMSLFKGAGMAAFATMTEIMLDKKMPAAVRGNMAKEIIERNLGKATQYLEVKASSGGDPVAESLALEAELERLRSDKTITLLPSPVTVIAEGETGPCPVRDTSVKPHSAPTFNA